MTDYAGLKAEIALPQYAGASDADIADSLNTFFAVTIDANAHDAYNIVLRSPTYDMAKVVMRSKQAVGTKPELDNAVFAATNFVTTFNAALTNSLVVLRTSNAEDLGKLQNDLSLLEAAGDVSPDSIAAIMALTQGTTSRTQQLGFDQNYHDMEHEIAVARVWTP